ncbi:MAG: glycosyltransferase family 4 protein [bacterium]|nr:glycosyltransferase family 4 protein [bacterium]
MKVLLAQETFLPKLGGAEVHVWQLSRVLRSRGCEITIATATPGETQHDGIPVYRFPLLRSQGPKAIAALPIYLPRLATLVASHDVIHGHYTALLSAVVGTLARILGRRFVVTLHGYGTLESSVRASPWLRMWRRLAFRAADTVIATSPEIADVARNFVQPSRVVFIPNGVDTTQFAPTHGDPPPPVRVVSIRRLVPKNGVQYLVDAIPQVLAGSPVPVEFWIVGDGPLRDRLVERARGLGVEHAVRFLGSLENRQVREVLARAHIVVFPSSAESISIAALEAMSMRKAVVASSVGGFPELLGNDERGLLVPLFDRVASDYQAPPHLPPERLRALADAILRLITDEELARTLGRRARAYVQEQMDWRMIATRVMEVYAAPQRPS